ncbi:AraC family transcriptional regulator [Granulosicoccus antarcticus]|uniref:Melibiose operon regulatory protein n=1 Tax=Granulosicoccus antarcticus IMCC3135 TaxID=1192854 RepID=A0A2Z2NHW5_9GAMM|nr:helix-turn-helix domain-containing protein [Granulosicoccus antarcticus]ASJ70643.1 Melibiose operon regulatory protein [Granulosicoccus antarcticus IMCC3135]
MTTLLTISIGFSVVSALMLLGTYSLLYHRWNKSWTSIATAAILLLTFCVTQLLHLQHIDNPEDLFASKWYSTLILLSSPAFYLFLREYLLVDARLTLRSCLHAIPLLLNLFIDNRFTIPAAFVLGATYMAISLFQLYQLRDKRQRFRIELFAVAFFLLTAVVISVLAAVATIDASLFVTGYGLLIGLSFLVVLVTLLVFPDVATNLGEAAEVRYAKTTLTQVNRPVELVRLSALMVEDKLYRNENLSLSMVAEHLGLSQHQLSELINAEHGYGFSQFIREHRINDAKQQLLTEPTASVLAISLAAGFTSQSSFYTAFSQIVGESPGKYRKRHQA